MFGRCSEVTRALPMYVGKSHDHQLYDEIEGQ